MGALKVPLWVAPNCAKNAPMVPKMAGPVGHVTPARTHACPIHPSGMDLSTMIKGSDMV